MYDCIVCRYHEIATKGENRRMFEEKLVENLRYQCGAADDYAYSRVRGRIYLRKKGGGSFTPDDIEYIKTGLKRTAGLETFSPAMECEPSMEKIFELLDRYARDIFAKAPRNADGKVEFRVRARRSNKQFPLISRDIEIEVATKLESIFGENNLKVNLDNPALSIGVEIRDVNALVYLETFHGAGGLPVGSNGQVLALLSGGIDSPVACKMIMTRGCHVHYLTFHSYPYTPELSLEKVKRIAAELNRHQKPGKLYACNLSEIQKAIRDNCNPKYRTVLYRRMMMRIANMICHRKHLGAIVTGESVGQVASQTVQNLSTINESAEFVMLRPLCGMDKLETIRRAEELGTFPISIIPAPDSCTVFAPPSPSVSAKLDHIKAEEERLGDLRALTDAAYNTIETSDCVPE